MEKSSCFTRFKPLFTNRHRKTSCFFSKSSEKISYRFVTFLNEFKSMREEKGKETKLKFNCCLYLIAKKITSLQKQRIAN
jgi:hypothetical protein